MVSVNSVFPEKMSNCLFLPGNYNFLRLDKVAAETGFNNIDVILQCNWNLNSIAFIITNTNMVSLVDKGYFLISLTDYE